VDGDGVEGCSGGVVDEDAAADYAAFFDDF
jgi:hypothetical protein